MTDSEGDQRVRRRELEHKLIRALETAELSSTDGIPLDAVQSLLLRDLHRANNNDPSAATEDIAMPEGGEPSPMLLRFLRSLPTVELLKDRDAGGGARVRRVHQRPVRLLPKKAGGGLRGPRGQLSKPASTAGGGAALAAQQLAAAAAAEIDEGVVAEHGRVGYVCIADEFDLPGLCDHYHDAGYHTGLAYDVLHVAPRPRAAHDADVRGSGAAASRSNSAAAAAASAASPSSPLLAGRHQQQSQQRGTTAPPPNDPSSHFDLFIFDYGAVVWWGAAPRMYSIVESDFTSETSKLNRYFTGRYKTSTINDNFPVWCAYSSDTSRDVSFVTNHEPDRNFKERLQYDHFLVPSNSADIKLCISHALAQSAKIDYLEIKVGKLTKDCKPLPHELKEFGWVTIPERKLLQLRGEVLYYRLMLKSGGDLLDEPELFWQNPWLKPFYNLVKEVWQIPERVDTLDAKLDATNEILSMISDQFNQRHGSRLEWIVIILVLVEVIIGVLELIIEARPWKW